MVPCVIPMICSNYLTFFSLGLFAIFFFQLKMFFIYIGYISFWKSVSIMMNFRFKVYFVKSLFGVPTTQHAFWCLTTIPSDICKEHNRHSNRPSSLYLLIMQKHGNYWVCGSQWSFFWLHNISVYSADFHCNK